MSDQNSNSIENFVTETKCEWKQNSGYATNSRWAWCLADTKTSECYSNTQCKAKGCDNWDCNFYNN